MPNYVSKDGVWYVAKERVALKNLSNKTITNPSEEGSKYHGEQVKPGEPFIYEGPDRAAMFELFKIDPSGGVTTLGEHFTDNVDMQERTRQRGYKSVIEYAKAFGYSKEAVENKFSELISEVKVHELPSRVAMVEATQSGAHDFSGQGKHMKGGFGEQPSIR